MGPIVLGRARSNAEDFRCFLAGHAGEVTQLDQLRFDFVFGGKFVEGFADSKELVVVAGRREVHFLKVHPLLIAAVTNGTLATGAIDEGAAHRLGGGGEEMGAFVPFLILVADQPQPGFVNERGRLQGLADCFAGHLVCSQAT